MGRGYKVAAIALGVCIAFILALGLVVSLWQWPANQSTYQQAQQEQADGPPDANGTSVGMGFWDTYAWPRDSLTQWIMAALAVAATGVSIWAVLLLKATLKATRDALLDTRAMTEAALEANDILRAEQRAWLTITLTSVAETGNDRNKIEAHVTYRIDNLGKAPSLVAREYIGIFPLIGEANVAEDLERFALKCRENFETEENRFERRIFPGHPFEGPIYNARPVDADVARSDPSGFYIFCCIVYRHSPDNSIGCTAEAYVAGRSNSILSWLHNSLGNYPTRNVRTQFASTTFSYMT